MTVGTPTSPRHPYGPRVAVDSVTVPSVLQAVRAMGLPELTALDSVPGNAHGRTIYGDVSYARDETGTDLAAVAQGKIAVTPIHFDLTDREGLTALQRYDLTRLIAPAASEVDG